MNTIRQNSAFFKILIIFVLKGLFSVDCLQCFECDSRKIGQNCLTNPPPSRKCLDKHSLYCVAMKHYDKHGNITGVIRACSKVNFGLKCRLAQSEHEPYKTCFNTCWEDACNRSTFPLLSSRLLALVGFCYLIFV